MFWFGIQVCQTYSTPPQTLTLLQSYTGSEAIFQMLKAIWPNTARIPNHLGENASITTSGIMCYFLYWLIQFPFMFLSPQRLRYLFAIKSVLVPIAWISILIWAMIKAPPSVSLDSSPAKVSGSTASWLWLGAMNSAIGNYSTLSVNIPDFTRYAKSARS